jgi:hypothetical protein
VAPDDPHHLTLLIDEADARHAYFIVNSGPFAGGSEVKGWSGYV